MIDANNMQLFCQTFALTTDYTFAISKYELTESGILIKEIKVFDSEGEFIRTADLKNVLKNLHKYNTVFLPDGLSE